MIGMVKGEILFKNFPNVLVNTGNIGYNLMVPMSSFLLLGEKMEFSFWTYLIVREDSHSLYGFATLEEKQFFITLIKVNGVGPKMAISILSTFTLNEMIEIVKSNQSKILTKIPGVGLKTAERLILELKDKLKLSFQNQSEDINKKYFNEALEALLSLGYKESEIFKILNKIDCTNLSTEDIVKQVLKLSF